MRPVGRWAVTSLASSQAQVSGRVWWLERVKRVRKLGWAPAWEELGRLLKLSMATEA